MEIYIAIFWMFWKTSFWDFSLKPHIFTNCYQRKFNGKKIYVFVNILALEYSSVDSYTGKIDKDLNHSYAQGDNRDEANLKEHF